MFVYTASITWEELYELNWGNLTLTKSHGQWIYQGAINIISDSEHILTYHISFPPSAESIIVDHGTPDLGIFLSRMSTQISSTSANLTLQIAIQRTFPWETTSIEVSKTPTALLSATIVSTMTCTFTEGVGEICEETWTIVLTVEYVTCSISGDYALQIGASTFGSEEIMSPFEFEIESNDLCPVEIGEAEIHASLESFSDAESTNATSIFETSDRVYFVPYFSMQEANPSFYLESISITMNDTVVDVYSNDDSIAEFDVVVESNNHFSFLLPTAYIPATIEGFSIDVDVEFQVAYESGRRRLIRITWNKLPHESFPSLFRTAKARTSLLIKPVNSSTLRTRDMFWRWTILFITFLSVCVLFSFRKKKWLI